MPHFKLPNLGLISPFSISGTITAPASQLTSIRLKPPIKGFVAPFLPTTLTLQHPLSNYRNHFVKTSRLLCQRNMPLYVVFVMLCLIPYPLSPLDRPFTPTTTLIWESKDFGQCVFFLLMSCLQNELIIYRNSLRLQRVV